MSVDQHPTMGSQCNRDALKRVLRGRHFSSFLKIREKGVFHHLFDAETRLFML